MTDLKSKTRILDLIQQLLVEDRLKVEDQKFLDLIQQQLVEDRLKVVDQKFLDLIPQRRRQKFSGFDSATVSWRPVGSGFDSKSLPTIVGIRLCFETQLPVVEFCNCWFDITIKKDVVGRTMVLFSLGTVVSPVGIGLYDPLV